MSTVAEKIFCQIEVVDLAIHVSIDYHFCQTDCLIFEFNTFSKNVYEVVLQVDEQEPKKSKIIEKLDNQQEIGNNQHKSTFKNSFQINVGNVKNAAIITVKYVSFMNVSREYASFNIINKQYVFKNLFKISLKANHYTVICSHQNIQIKKKEIILMFENDNFSNITFKFPINELESKIIEQSSNGYVYYLQTEQINRMHPELLNNSCFLLVLDLTPDMKSYFNEVAFAIKIFLRSLPQNCKINILSRSTPYCSKTFFLFDSINYINFNEYSLKLIEDYINSITSNFFTDCTKTKNEDDTIEFIDDILKHNTFQSKVIIFTPSKFVNKISLKLSHHAVDWNVFFLRSIKKFFYSINYYNQPEVEVFDVYLFDKLLEILYFYCVKPILSQPNDIICKNIMSMKTTQINDAEKDNVGSFKKTFIMDSGEFLHILYKSLEYYINNSQTLNFLHKNNNINFDSYTVKTKNHQYSAYRVKYNDSKNSIYLKDLLETLCKILLIQKPNGSFERSKFIERLTQFKDNDLENEECEIDHLLTIHYVAYVEMKCSVLKKYWDIAMYKSFKYIEENALENKLTEQKFKYVEGV